MTQNPTHPDPDSVPAVSPPSGHVDLGVSCTLHEAAALRSACLAALDSKDPPALDGSRVERVDTAGLQVLVGFTIDCIERSLHFTWAGRSEALVRGIRLLGLEALLESPGAAPAPAGGEA
jgi:phospholipid transport system transporter-binding protein